MHLTLTRCAPAFWVLSYIYDSLKDNHTESQGLNWQQLPSAPAVVTRQLSALKSVCVASNPASTTYWSTRFPTPVLPPLCLCVGTVARVWWGCCQAYMRAHVKHTKHCLSCRFYPANASYHPDCRVCLLITSLCAVLVTVRLMLLHSTSSRWMRC